MVANRQAHPEPLLAAAVEELNREYGDRGSDAQQSLDELHVMVLARAPLAARLPVLWRLARHRTAYEQDLPAWERARLEQMDDEAKQAAPLADPRAAPTDQLKALEMWRNLVIELMAPDWRSEQDRRRRLVEMLEKRIAGIENRVRQQQNAEAAQRQAQNLESLARQMIEVYQARDARRLASLVEPWNALLRVGLRPGDPQTLRAVEETLVWLEGEQGRLRAEQETEARQQLRAGRIAEFESAVASFKSGLQAGMSVPALTNLRKRAQSLGDNLGRSPPAALEEQYQERLRGRRVWLWYGGLAAAALAGVLLVGGGLFYLYAGANDAGWRECVVAVRGATEEFQRQADAFVPDPTAPLPDTDRLAKSYQGFRDALDRARRLAGTPVREGEIETASAAHTTASSSLESRVGEFLKALDGGLENAEQNLNDNDLDNALGIVEQKWQQISGLAGLEPLLPAVANRLSQLKEKCEALRRRVRAEQAKRELPAKLVKLSTIYSGTDAADRVHAYADVLREFAEHAPSDERAEDFFHAAEEESLWVKAFQRKAFAVGWLQKRGSSAKPWRCETTWRPTPGAKYTLNVMLPASGGAAERLAKIGEMDGTRPVLDASLPQETWLQGRLVFALKSDD